MNLASSQRSLPDRIVVGVGRFLFLHVFPRIGNRGAWRVGRLPWLKDRLAVVETNGVMLLLPALDYYWARYFCTGGEYEPEVGTAIRLLTTTETDLVLDCGANYGYWAAQIANGVFGPLKIVAIEASSTTHTVLAKNLGANGKAVHAAVSDKPGFVNFDDNLPAAERKIEHGGSTRVPAVTLDELAGSADNVVIKLDVEGAETAAIAGAQSLLTRNVAFIYEDHSNDPACQSTEAMLAAGLNIFGVSEVGEVTTFADVEAVRSVKTGSTKGYNFVAVTPRSGYEHALTTALLR